MTEQRRALSYSPISEWQGTHSYGIRRLNDGTVKGVPFQDNLARVSGSDLGTVVNSCVTNIYDLGTVSGAVYQGGSIYISPATYPYSTGIDLRPTGRTEGAHIVLQGGGIRGTKLNFTGTGSAIKLHGDSSANNAQGRAAIRDMSIEGGNSGDSSIGIDLKTFERHLALENLYLLNFDVFDPGDTGQKTGIKLQDCLNGVMKQVFIEECTYGLHVLGDDAPSNIPNNTWNYYGLHILRPRNDDLDAGRGIWFQGKNVGHNFYGGSVQTAHEAEIYIDPESSGDIQAIKFDGMWFETNTAPSTAHAIHVVESGTGVIRGLKFRDLVFAGSSYETGIYLDGPQDTVVDGCLFRGFNGQVGGNDQKPVETTANTSGTRITNSSFQLTPAKPYSLNGMDEYVILDNGIQVPDATGAPQTVFQWDDLEKLGFFGATPVAQSTGWSTSNVTTTKTFDANSTSIDELADVLGTLIEYLLSRGDLGA